MEVLYHLVETYRPEILWSDGEWEAHSDSWKSKEFLAWLANDSLVKHTAVWNDRWGVDASKLGTPGNAARDRIDAEPRFEPHQR